MAQELRYQGALWEIRGKAGISFYDFPVQTVSPTNPAKFSKSSLVLSLRVEKKLYQFLKIFADYERDESLSSEPSDRYRANTFSGGLDWEF
jgi:hypothetical protein